MNADLTQAIRLWHTITSGDRDVVYNVPWIRWRGLVEVVGNIRKSHLAHWRPIGVIYKNPVVEQELFVAGRRKTKEFTFCDSWLFDIYSATGAAEADAHCRVESPAG